jgi:hypothetical protein
MLIYQLSFHDDAKRKEFEQAGAKWRSHEVLGVSRVRFISLPTSRHDYYMYIYIGVIEPKSARITVEVLIDALLRYTCADSGALVECC